MSGDWRLQLFFLSSTYFALICVPAPGSAIHEILSRTQRNAFSLSPYQIRSLPAPLCKICTVAKFCWPHCNSFAPVPHDCFPNFFAPITTAISRRCPSTADARDKTKSAPDVCPVLSPSICMVLSHNKPLRFCCVILGFSRSGFFSLYM